MEDLEIIAGLLRRDDSVLEALQEKYGARLFRLAGRFLSKIGRASCRERV